MERMYGWTRADVLGKLSQDVLRTQFPRPLAEIEATVLREGRWEGELLQRHRDGLELVVASTWVLHRDAQGDPGAIIEINTDITELKRAQEALRDADHRKDEFLGMLSHELRNPLAPIRNSLYILDRTDPSGQQARRAKEVATRQVAHITRLVDDLLDVTRIVRGKIELRGLDLDLAALARRTADDYRALISDRGLDFEVDVPGVPVFVNGDETRLAQVLGNLLSNAAKFTPAGGRVSLTVQVHAPRVAVHVRDTGPGIAADVLPTIFEPFTQAKQTLARSEGGLGLGLALVRGLVALHGGEVSVRSPDGGQGTEFVVALPLTAPRATSTGQPETRATPIPRHRRVLVIDDNRDAAESLAALVGMMGHETEVAYDGFQGLRSAAERFPDVVLCDIGLPGMDGYEFARQLRARAGKRAVRLVAVSGYAQPEDVAKAAEAGFDAHVAKPPDPEKLASLLG
jgi:PAS domain S-box-containing protein